MTNFEIITQQAMINNLFTKEEAQMYLSEGLSLPIHTFQEWHNLGYRVRKGEKAKMTCRIWKYSTKNIKAVETEQGAEEQEQGGHYYLANAYFFTKDQVEKITEAE